MSLITRCPACGTMFKVVADQLKIAQGWVRCGQCGEVFDASGQLQTGDA
ncbi:MAG: zinc-ribbon domain-containing protein, partial [Polaromonas sp.]